MYRTSPHFPHIPASWFGSDKVSQSHGYNPHYATPSWPASIMKHYQNPQNQNSYSGYGYPPTPPDDSHGNVHNAHHQHQQNNPQQQQQEHPMSTSPALPPTQLPSSTSNGGATTQQHHNSQHPSDQSSAAERMSPGRVAGADTPLETESSGSDIKPALESSYHSVFGANFSSKSSLSLSSSQSGSSTAAVSGYSGYPTGHSSMEFPSSGYPSFYPSTTMASVFSKPPFGTVPTSAASPGQDKSKNSKRSTTGKINKYF